MNSPQTHVRTTAFSRRPRGGAGVTPRAAPRGAAKRLVALALLVCAWAAGSAAADDPPVRLQKKDRPPPELVPEKIPVLPKEERQPAAPPEGVQLQQSIEEALARLTRDLEKADERLGQKDVGPATRQAQTDVVRGFDALIEHVRRQQQQQQDSASAAEAAKRRQKQEGRQQTAKNTSGQKPQPQPGQQPQDQPSNTGQGGGRSAEEQRKLADLYKDVWGHLPETLRQQMDAYGREQFMAKHSELLKQYYATLAEKGRQKRD